MSKRYQTFIPQMNMSQIVGSVFFTVIFYALTAFFAVLCALLAIIPGRKPMMAGLWTYTRLVRWLLAVICEVDVKVTHKERLPKDGAFIIAAKHQSYGDGIVMFSEFFDLSFVTGDHLEKFTLLKTILRKAGAVVVDSCGGSDVQEKMTRQAERVKKEERKLLIYPEGHLSPPGAYHRYRKGVYHMYRDFDCPVVPAATNLGQRWDQDDWRKHPGEAVIEFLEPIPTGLGKEEFMERLETAIETRSRELLDLETPGALDPKLIGEQIENHSAREKRLRREAEAARTGIDYLNRGARS